MNTSRLAVPANPCEVAQQRALASRQSATFHRRIPTGWNVKSKLIAALMCLGAIGQTGTAASLKLAWNPNPESDIAGYRLSYGTSPGNYSGTVATGNVTTATVAGLEEGQTYYFSLKAVNTAGVQSASSSEISHLIPTSTTTPGLPLISNAGWRIWSVSSEEPPTYAATRAFDGNPSTFWHTRWSTGAPTPPHEIAIDLGAVQLIGGFCYLPRQDNYTVGNIARYEFHVSLDGINWGSPVAQGTFANSRTEKEVRFAASVSGRYVKLRQITEVSGMNDCNVAELKLLQGTAVVVTPPPNVAPVAAAQAVSTPEDEAIAIRLAASDADDDALDFRIVSQPSKGTLSGSAPNLTYTPAAHVHGSDSFTFLANDGTVDSNIGTVAITITGVNDAPAAANQSLNATAGTPLVITLAASDIEGNPLSYRVIDNPTQGALSGTAPNLTYTPLASASGPDSFTFRANDGSADSNTATVTLSITPTVDTPPALPLISNAGWQIWSVSSEEPPTYAAARAYDGNPSTFWHTRWSTGSATPPHEIAIDLGAVQSIGGFCYLPRQDNYTVGNIRQYEFHVSLDGSNWGSPVAQGAFANGKTEKEVRFATSVSGRYVKLRQITEVSGMNDCNVAELKLLQGTAVVVTPPPNVAPVAAAQSVTAAEDQAIAINLTASDANGDALSYYVVHQPAIGTLSGSPPNLTYTPHEDAHGSDSFTFRVNDGSVDSDTAIVSIDLTAVNDTPFALSQEIVTLEDKTVGILLQATDKDGDFLSYRVLDLPSKGKLSGTAPNLTYTPNRDVNGSDSFTFISNDGTADSAIATVSIVITPVNDAPVAAARFVSTAANASAIIVLSATDKDGDPLSYAIVSQPMKGVLSGAPPRLTYTPFPGAGGSDSLRFRAHDGTVNSNTATIAITLVPVVNANANAAPEFQFSLIRRSKATAGEEYASAPLVGTAIDPDGDMITYSRGSGPEWLTIGPDGALSGTPTAEMRGINKFVVRATDGEGATAESSLEIEVVANDLPLPWTLARMGAVDEQAAASGDSLAIRLLSPGVLAGTADSGLFAWQTLSGDGEITVRIREVENHETTTRIGLMIRESLAPGSKHTFIGSDGRGDVHWIRRDEAAGDTSTSTVAAAEPLGLWLRLGREGTTVSAFTSRNGSDWTRVGLLNVDLGNTCYIGLSAHSGSDDRLTATVFENITVIP